MSVKVGVRVRPFNQREIDLNCRLCVKMIGSTTRLFEQHDEQKFRDFTFDYSFWSHDEFHVDETGYFVADSQKYADQRQVFQNVGKQILTNAWQGYHCCLFAYGQTGSGKSYSMVGYGANKGIVPISCSEIFQRIEQNQDPNKQYEVNVSMLEIYNQRVQDLLIPINKRPKQGYKIREHPSLGIYVEGLSKHYVDTYKAIEEKMEEGSKHRSIAATEMNASSSRAHTIISIQFRQKQLVEGKKRQKLSVIHLVDLAGSEKISKTGATGDRLNEAKGINKSLSVLGLVISTLADKAMGKTKGVVVPYRDSCLTRILQNALGGNSKTLMICAISPANNNYEQTVSTLRYADQAKKIKNNAVVNQSETDKIIRNLTAQKQQLREKVAKFQQMFQKLSQGLGIDKAKLQEFNDAKQQLRFNTMMMNDYAMTKQEKLLHENEQNNQLGFEKIDMSKPHISNLNQDPMLSLKIHYSIDRQCTTIGRRNMQPQNNIEIGGMGIRNLHAIVNKQEGQEQDLYYISPKYDEQQGEDSACYLNGDVLATKTQLMNYDRLSFGTNNMFLVAISSSPIRDEVDPLAIDWQYAQNQLYLRKQLIQKQQMQQKQKRYKYETQQILIKKQQQLEQLQRKLKQNEEERKNIEQQKQIEKAQIENKLREQQAERLKSEIEKDKKKIEDRQSLQKQRVKQKYYFEKKLLKTLPKCIELNLIAKQFKRNISMSVKMLLPNEKQQENEQDMDLRKRSIKVKVVNREVGYTYWWDVEKLSNRYYIIKDMSQAYFETGVIPELTEKQDPFWDPPEHVLIGRAFLTTKALSYMFDNLTSLSIIGEDDHCGEITVNMIPTDETGQRNLCEQMDSDETQFEPQDLMDKPFYYNVVIQSAKIPQNYQKVYVEYCVKVDEKKVQTYMTKQVQEKTTTPKFDYKRLHHFPKITDILLNYLSTAKIIFKVYACELIPKEKHQPPQQNKETSKPKITMLSSNISGSPVKVQPEIQNVKKSFALPEDIKKTVTSSPQTPNNGTSTAKKSSKKKEKGKEECMIF